MPTLMAFKCITLPVVARIPLSPTSYSHPFVIDSEVLLTGGKLFPHSPDIRSGHVPCFDQWKVEEGMVPVLSLPLKRPPLFLLAPLALLPSPGGELAPVAHQI